VRETFTTLYQKARDLCVDPSTTSQTGITDTATFLKAEINRANRHATDFINNFKTRGSAYTLTTSDGTQFYDYPPGVSHLSSVVITVGGVDYPCTFVDSEKMWNDLNMIEIASFTVPQFVYPRAYDFGIFPIPRDAYTTTLNGNYIPADMSMEDVTSGTIALTNASATVTGTNTAFTSSMVGSFLKVSGYWYKILSYASATSITLDRTYVGTTASGLSYTIGNSPEIPEEAHEYLPFRAASIWFVAFRRDTKHAQKLLNYYYTGDFENYTRDATTAKGGMIGVREHYRQFGRGNSQLTQRNKTTDYVYDERWATTLSAS